MERRAVRAAALRFRRAGAAHGIRVFAGLLPGAGADPGTADALCALEEAAAVYPALRDIAARLHVLGHR